MNKIQKFESEQRLNELKPQLTLEKIGLTSGMKLFDLGAGTGIFSIPASHMTDQEVYALEISDDMIKILNQRQKEQSLKNLIIKKVTSDQLPLPEYCCDLGLMVTVFHELDQQETILQEIRRILKADGRLIIIDFHKRRTPFGPPVHHRIAKEEIIKLCQQKDFTPIDDFSLGENFYCIIFEK
jgi:ubiquinone/menaquinone biosynthesis C-methylase UbiE